MFKKKLVAVTALTLMLTAVPVMAPAVSAQAADVTAVSGSSITVERVEKTVVKKVYKPVDAKNLTSSYKKKLAKQRKNTIKVSSGNYESRVEKEQKALIDVTWAQLKKYSQVKISKKSFDLMCRVVQCEAGNVKYATKEMTAECIVNRARNYKTSDQVLSALKAPGQFTVVRGSRINNVDINGETVNACKDALLKNSHPKSLKFFRAGYFFSSSWAKPYKSSDGTYFSLAK